jgi:hypothetical protein
MTGVNFASLVRNYTRTNSTVLADAEIVLLANAVKDEFAPLIMEADENLFGIPATRDIIASDASDFTAREYSLPDDLLALKSVDAILDGVAWVHLTELDLTRFKRVADEATVIAIFNNGEVSDNNPNGARFDIFRKSLWLYSGTIVASADGLKLWYIAYPADITAATLALSTDISIDPSSVSSALPRQFHELWARRISILWKSNREKPIALTEREQVFAVDFKAMIGSLKNLNKDRSNVASLPSDRRLQV